MLKVAYRCRSQNRAAALMVMIKVMDGQEHQLGVNVGYYLRQSLFWFRGDTKPGRLVNLKCRLVCDLASVVGHKTNNGSDSSTCRNYFTLKHKLLVICTHSNSQTYTSSGKWE